MDPELFRKTVSGIYVFLQGVPQKGWHVIFSCGTVASIRSGDGEFAGYTADSSPYNLPDTVEDIDRAMTENQKVWEAQRGIAGEVGLAVRRGYAKLFEHGYPSSSRATALPPVDTGISIEGAGKLWIVGWKGASKTLFNVFLADRVRDQARELRGRDYISPVVGAVISDRDILWMYNAEGVFCDMSASTETDDG